jgi:hypothetical protein
MSTAQSSRFGRAEAETPISSSPTVCVFRFIGFRRTRSLLVFGIQGDNRLAWTNHGKCVDLTGGSTTDGNPVSATIVLDLF